MLIIEDYMNKSKNERQEHLNLAEQCIERGSTKKNGVSFYCKGLLAHILDTTIPSGHTILLCHACHNSACCNPNHLYWGSAKENTQDAIDNGAISVWDRTVAKYGLEKAKEFQSRGDKAKGAKISGSKPKSSQHKTKLSESIKKAWADGKFSDRKK